jgi:alkylhydroperoxidase family enzyme
MPRIQWITDEQATGETADVFEEIRNRTGTVHGILRALSWNPRFMRSIAEARGALLRRDSPSPLTFAHRQMIAARVAALNRCHH